jgi:hypothetical protein
MILDFFLGGDSSDVRYPMTLVKDKRPSVRLGPTLSSLLVATFDRKVVALIRTLDAKFGMLGGARVIPPHCKGSLVNST